MAPAYFVVLFLERLVNACKSGANPCDLIFKELKGKFVLTGPVAQVLEISFSVKDVDHRAEGEIVRLQIAPADLLKDLSGFLIKGTEFFASIRTMNSKRTVDTSSIEKVLIAGSGRGFFCETEKFYFDLASSYQVFSFTSIRKYCPSKVVRLGVLSPCLREST